MVEGKYINCNDNLEDAIFIRKKVFLIEQNNIQNIEFDSFDQEAIHAVVYVDKNPVATARLIYEGSVYHMEKVAVLKEERGKGYGDFVVRLIVDKAFLMGAKEVIIKCDLHEMKFYEKIGFVSFGEESEEVKTSYILMKLKSDGIKKNCQR